MVFSPSTLLLFFGFIFHPKKYEKNSNIYLLFFNGKILYNRPMKAIEGEKRGLERFELEIPARIEVTTSPKEEKALDLITSDISSGGAFFHTAQPLEEGTDVKIDLILPIKRLMKEIDEATERGLQHTYIKISGKVLRTESRGMAILFNEDYEISPWQGEKTVEH
jgi:hypothetical protein